MVAEMTNNGSAGIPMENELGYFAPGTAQFDEAFNRITSAKNNAEEQGTRFSDRSALYNGQAQYQWDWRGWMMKAGASGRLYRPYSLGTIFSDTSERITTYEFGFYQGIEKHWMEDKIITTATLRVDKNKNFNWIWSPAASMVFKPAKDHYIRLSFSSALRNPTLTDQYLFLNVGPAILSGNLTGADSLITLDSFLDYRNSLDTDKLTYFSVDPLRPERVKSIELGYRGAFFNKLFLDLSGYYSIYQDFIGYNIGITSDFDPLTGLPSNIQVYRYAANSRNQVTTAGLSLGTHYYVNDHHTLNFNYSFNQLLKESEVFDPIIPAFNTPKHKFNIGVSGEHLLAQNNGNDWGYSINYKWIQGFLFEGSPQFTGMIPTYDLVDAQINYEIKKVHLNVKLGASNLMNNMQFQTYGGPRIGRLAYLSLRYEFQKTK
jgi:outer membrane receptor protein involved in Fe transport